MNIKPIKKVSISEQVFAQLKDQLIEGAWKPGEKLPTETQLCKLFNVSRITIRNALQQLNTLGLIETRRGEGSFVVQEDTGRFLNTLVPTAYLQANMLEIQEFRFMVEAGAAYMAAQRASDDDIRDLRSRLERMQALREDLYTLAQEDFAFHNQIGLITGNPLMIRTYSILTDVLHSAMETVVSHMGPDAGYYYHARIVDAIASHDSHEAYNIMQQHIESNMELYRSTPQS